MLLIVSALLLLLLTLKLYRPRLTKKNARLQQQGLLSITLLLELINLLQRYRQFRSLQSSNADMEPMQNELARVLARHEQIPVVKSHARWHAFKDHWSRLYLKRSGVTYNQLEQYQHLLGNLFCLQADLLNVYKLQPNYLNQSPPINLLLQDLPLLIEQHHQLQIRVILYYRQQYNLNHQKRKLQKELTNMRQCSLKLLPQLTQYQPPLQQQQTGQIARHTAQLVTRVSTELLTENWHLLSEALLMQLGDINIQGLTSLQQQALHTLEFDLAK